MSEVFYTVANQLRQVYWRVAQPETRGVKVFALHPEREAVLLIRNSYGDSAIYTLPGGGIKRRETAEAAARREIREEVGIEIEGLRQLGADYINTAEYKIDTVATIGARATSSMLLPNKEIAQAEWQDLNAIDRLEPVSGFVLRAIAEYRTSSE